MNLISHYFKHHTGWRLPRTFVNVYLWSRHYKVQFAIVENALVFKSEDDGRLSFAFQSKETENIKKALAVLKQYSEEGYPFSLYNVTPDNFERLERWISGRFQIEYLRAKCQTIYMSREACNTFGKKLMAEEMILINSKLSMKADEDN
ncbi:MAG: hypothetical protein V8S08_09980, partial [Lachnoclostridium sp.]